MTQKIILQDAFKGFTLDQDKIISPSETIERFKKKLNKLDMNILKETKRIDNGRLGIPVYFSICGSDAIKITGTKKQMGKGATSQQAEASAVMELAERFSFFSFCNDKNNFFTEKYSKLKDEAIPFDMIAQSVHDKSEELRITQKIFDNLTLKWTWGYNMTMEKKVLIPFDWFYTINEFNGPCAGNCVEEAISQGICEIVERHVSSIISQNRLQVPVINGKTATDPMVLEMLAKYESNGIKLYLSDFSLDMGIPTVGILAYDPTTFPDQSEIVWTAGTTPDPQKALSRALTEVAQLAGDFNSSSNYIASGLPKFSKIEDADFIINHKTQINISALPNLADNNIKVEVLNMIKALEKKGMEVLVINTMHPGLKIPAFYTIIPGAHFRERAMGTSTGMFIAKIITENRAPAQAVKELKEMQDLLPERYYLQFYLGSAHLNLNDYTTAYEYFKNAMAFEPTPQDIPTIYSYMGICLKDMGKYNRALEVLKKGEAFDKERTDIYNLMGFCHFKLKEHEKAIECFNQVLRLDPGSAIDYANIASNYRELGEKNMAIQYYEIALKLDPSIAFARSNLDNLTK